MMERKILLPAALSFLIFVSTACHTHPHDQDREEETIAVTVWTDSFELFMEYPKLRVGRPARFAAHLTNLRTFEPVTSGPVTFEFSEAGRTVQEVTLAKPIRPGIFVLEVTFGQTGSLTLEVIVQSPSHSGVIRVSPIQVYGPDEAAPAVEEVSVQGDRISYLKEQQWKLPFRTEKASRHTLNESVLLSGMVLSRTDSDFRVLPPLAGRFVPAAAGSPILGQAVNRGKLLGWIEPPLPEPEAVAMENARIQTAVALAQLEEKVAEARARLTRTEAELDIARREKERTERLLQLEAVPQRRLEGVRFDLVIAGANLNAARQNLQTLLAARERLERREKSSDTDQHRLPLYAPGSGTIVESTITAGAFASLQQTLFRIVDLSRVWIRAEVHETDLSRVQGTAGRALARLPDQTAIEVGKAGDRLLLIGGVVDPETRTFPIVWEVANSNWKLKVGLLLEIQVFTAEEVDTLAVPVSAVFREENKSIVYVQVAGETFDRRIVETGAQDEKLIQIRSGVSRGERVVVEGGYEVGLAARSTSGAGEGHVH